MATPECNGCPIIGPDQSFYVKLYKLLLKVGEEKPSDDIAIIRAIQDDILQKPRDIGRLVWKSSKVVNLIFSINKWHYKRSVNRSTSLAEIMDAFKKLGDMEPVDGCPSFTEIISYARETAVKDYDIIDDEEDDRSWIASYIGTCIEATMVKSRKRFDERNAPFTNLRNLIATQIRVARGESNNFKKPLRRLILAIQRNKKCAPFIIRRLNQVGKDSMESAKHHTTKLVRIAKLMYDHHLESHSNFTDREIALTGVLSLLRRNIDARGNMSYILNLLEVADGDEMTSRYPFLLVKRDDMVDKALLKVIVQLKEEGDKGMCGRAHAGEICQYILADWRSQRLERPVILDHVFFACMEIHNAQAKHYSECTSCSEKMAQNQ